MGTASVARGSISTISGNKHAANWRNYREMLTETEQVFLLSIIPETE